MKNEKNYMAANFEAFYKGISSSINLLFLKSEVFDLRKSDSEALKIVGFGSNSRLSAPSLLLTAYKNHQKNS